MFFSGLNPLNSLKVPIQIIILLIWSPASPLSHRAPSRAVSYSQGLSIPTWTGITPCPNICQELMPFMTWTPPESHCNTQLPFLSNSSSSFISIWTFCDSKCHYWVLSAWFRGTFPPFIKDTSVTLWAQILSGDDPRLPGKGLNWSFPPAPGRRRDLLSVYDQTSDCFSCDDVGCPDILPARKKHISFSYFRDNLLISNIQLLKHSEDKFLPFTAFPGCTQHPYELIKD